MKNLELEAQTQKTLEASDTLKKFLAMFSHELRSPLNSIIGFSELLAAHDGAILPPETMQEFMKNIQASGRHLQQILNDILDLSKIEAGQTGSAHRQLSGVAISRKRSGACSPGPLADKQMRCSSHLTREIDETGGGPDPVQADPDQSGFQRGEVQQARRDGDGQPRRGWGTTCVYRAGLRGSGIRPEEIPGLFKPFRQATERQGQEQRRGSDSGSRSPRSSWSCTAGRSGWRASGGRGRRSRSRFPMVVDATSEQIMQAGMLLDALQARKLAERGG